MDIQDSGNTIIPLCTTATVETLPMPNIELYLSIVMMLAPVPRLQWYKPPVACSLSKHLNKTVQQHFMLDYNH